MAFEIINLLTYYIQLPLLCLTPLTEGFPWDDLRKNFTWMSTHGQRTKWRRNIVEIFSRLSRVHERYRQTTDGRTIDDVNVSSRSLIKNKKFIRRWDSERELSLRRHCTRTKNTIGSCINYATDRFLQRRFTKFSEITLCNSHYAVQRHSRSPISVPIESSYDFLLVINTNLLPISHRFQVMADYWSNFPSRERSVSLYHSRLGWPLPILP